MMEEIKKFGIIEAGLKGVYDSDIKLHTLGVEVEFGSEVVKDGQVIEDFEIDCGEKSCHVVNSDVYGFSCALPLADHLTE